MMKSVLECGAQFSRWFRWKEREEYENIECPGVYLLAHFAAGTPVELNPQVREVVYIGQTWKQGLRKRLRKFEKSAVTGRHAHAGGRNYHIDFGSMREELCVAMWGALDLNPKTGPAFIRYIERKLIWEYAREWGETPCCNRK